MKTEQIQKTLEKLTDSSTGIEGAALVDRDGFIVASRLPDNMEEERVAAIMAAFQGLAQRCAEELGRGRPIQFFLQSESGYVVVADAGDDTCLAVVSTRSAKPGMLLLDLRRTVAEIRTLLSA